ncbi:MAG: serine/threonine-protein kinase [Candidatus Acidiferrum sp.]
MIEPDGSTRDDNPADLPTESTSSELPAPGAMDTVDAGNRASSDTVAGLSHGNRAPSEAKTIGPYRLVQKLGEGGMGQVWLAEQTSPFQRLVAVKLIRASEADGILLERFESERQVLARMNHPSIAKVFDAGTTSEGTPYFVMEYVPGIPITLYCDQKKLSIRQRIELFTKVCDGVQHAHQKAIIHRDLKPANILITEIDGQATPRIIDFGIAKAVRERDSRATMITQAGNFIGTPVYMSPEQSDPDIQDVDTRSDVYSLGVILYELLTGTLPFDPGQWRSAAMNESLRRLREQDPPRPSIQCRNQTTKERDTAEITAQLRSTEPKELVNALRGDLDWISMKALERDRARRYGTPSELGADLKRYIHSEPIEARPASAFYRMRKYAGRHRAGVAVAASLVAMLIAFAVIQTLQVRRITRERDRANRISDFMTRMFKVSDPSESRGNSVTAREILDRASGDIETELTNDPELQAGLMSTMGNVYMSLGLDSRGQSLLEKALAIQRHTLGADNPETLETAASLATELRYEGKYPESEKLERETVASQTRVLGAQNAKTLRTTSDLAATLFREGKYPEAETLQRETLEAQRKLLGPQNPDTLLSMRDLGTTLRKEGNYGGAEKILREVVEIQRRTVGSDHPDTLRSMNSLANVLLQEAKFAEADQLYREVYETRKRIEGPEHPDTVMGMTNLSNALSEEGHYAEAEKLQREALAVDIRTLGAENPQTLNAMENLSYTLGNENHLAEAEQLQRQVITVGSRVLGPEHSEVLSMMNGLAVNLERDGRYAEAEKLERETLETERRTLGAEKPQTLDAMNSLGATLQSEGRYAEAEKLQREALAIATRVIGPRHPDTLSIMSNLSETLQKEGQYIEEERIRREVLESTRQIFGADAPQTLNATGALAICLSYQNRYDEAKSLFAEAVQMATRSKRHDALSEAWYSSACGAAVAGHKEEALDGLKRALDAGYHDAEKMEKDEELSSLHGDVQFRDLCMNAQKNRATVVP